MRRTLDELRQGEILTYHDLHWIRHDQARYRMIWRLEEMGYIAVHVKRPLRSYLVERWDGGHPVLSSGCVLDELEGMEKCYLEDFEERTGLFRCKGRFWVAYCMVEELAELKRGRAK